MLRSARAQWYMGLVLTRVTASDGVGAIELGRGADP